MTTLQPLLALALAVLCALISGVPPGGKLFRGLSGWTAAAYIVFLAAATFCAIKLGHVDDQKAVIASMAAGALVCFASAVFSDLSVGVSIALATAGACVAHLIRADSFPEVSLVYAFSVSIGAVFFGSYQGAVAAGLIGGLITMADYLGKAGDMITNRALIGVAMGIALSVAAVLAVAIKRAVPKALGKLDTTLIAVLAAGAGFAVSKWAVGGELWIILGLASVSGLVVHWLVPPDEDAAPLRIGVAAVIWLALGTVAFSMLRGFGMATGVLEGIVVLTLLGNKRALFTVGPVLGLVIYRVLRDASPDSSRALDLGQHYGITGIAIGAVIPVLFADWYERKRADIVLQDAGASLLWGFILICLPVLAIVVLGAKGASGIVVGLGFSGLFLAYRKLAKSPAIAVVIAAGAANAVAVDWIGDALDMTRREKLHSFGWWALAMVFAAIGILVLSNRKATPEVA